MRPNIDVSPSLNGRVREYADARDLTLANGYREIIERGLEHTRLPASDADRDEVLGGGSLGRVRFTPTAHAGGHPVVTFSPTFTSGMVPPVVIGTSGSGMSSVSGQEELGDALAEAAPYLSNKGTGASWAIRQTTGLWYGEGLADYYTALDKQTQRYERNPIENPHHAEAATLVCPLKTASSAVLVIDSQPSQGAAGTLGGDRTRYFTLHFATEGYPVESTIFEKVAGVFGRELRHAKPMTDYFSARSIGGSSFISIDRGAVVDQIEYEDEYGPNWIEQIIVENPFRTEVVDQLSSLQYLTLEENSRREDNDLADQLTEMLQPDHILCHVKGHLETQEEITGYTVSTIDFRTDLPLVGGHGFANLRVEVQPQRRS